MKNYWTFSTNAFVVVVMICVLDIDGLWQRRRVINDMPRLTNLTPRTRTLFYTHIHTHTHTHTYTHTLSLPFTHTLTLWTRKHSKHAHCKSNFAYMQTFLISRIDSSLLNELLVRSKGKNLTVIVLQKCKLPNEHNIQSKYLNKKFILFLSFT